MKTKKIAINGFGRIGRAVLRILIEKYPNIDIVAVNDLAPNDSLVHLLKYDSIMHKFPYDLELKANVLHTQSQTIKLLSERDPEKLPWAELDVDLVLECTGAFRKKADANKHIIAGAKKVLLSAPPKDEWDAMVVMGINDTILTAEHKLVSNASCTTNCLAHVAKALDDEFKIKSSYMTTIHAYTNDQNVLDVYHPDPRRSRAAAQNIIPTSTGAAGAVAKVLPQLKGKIDGSAVRVPVANGSLVDFHMTLENDFTLDSVKQCFKAYAADKGQYMSICDDPIVSSDIIGTPFSCTIDTDLIQIQGELLRVVAWYDNEWGYSNRLAELCQKMMQL